MLLLTVMLDGGTFAHLQHLQLAPQYNLPPTPSVYPAIKQLHTVKNSLNACGLDPTLESIKSIRISQLASPD